ncbi:hypothetical protein KAX17_06180 [Candidatus Bipolaricaulota bacterium]|nr:hypothetical protein [Candidatus Bipolaricaulota bacterium]
MEKNKKERIKNSLVKASERYANLTEFRAAIQLIPHVGSAIDTLLCGKGAKIQHERVLHFLEELKRRLQKVEAVVGLGDEEDLFDLMLNVFDAVIRTKSEEKRKRFAALVTNQVVEKRPWEEADMAVWLLGGLSDLHVEILKQAKNAPLCDRPFENLKVLTLKEPAYEVKGGTQPLSLVGALPQYSDTALRMACAELVSKGLLRDEGVGHLDTNAMEYFVETNLTEWLLEWLEER